MAQRIRVKALPKYPVRFQSGTGIRVSRDSGVDSFNLDISAFPIEPDPDPTQLTVLGQYPDGSFRKAILATFTEGLDTAVADAEAAAASASADADLATSAASSATTAANLATNAMGVYVSTSAGISATTNGQYFYVPLGAPNITLHDLYRNVSGVATYVNSAPSVDASVQVSAGQLPTLKMILDGTTTSVFTRGSLTSATGLAAGATIFGWRSPFKHNGAPFNVVRLAFATYSAGSPVIRVEVLDSAGAILAGGDIEATGGTTRTIYTVPLSRLVTELAVDEIGFIRFYDPLRAMGLSVQTGGSYTGELDPNTYHEQFLASGGWSNVSGGTIGNVRAQFLAYDTALIPVDKVTPNSAGQIKSGYTPSVMWSSPQGDSEMDGDSTYSLAAVLGFYEYFTEAAVINTVQCAAWKSAAVDVEWKLWIRTTTTAFNMSSTAADRSGTISATSFPTSNALFKILLGDPLKVPGDRYVFLMLRPVDDLALSIRRWTTTGTGRHGFVIGGGTGWNNSWSLSSSPYLQTAPKFLLELASTAAPAAPELVAPTYVFGVQGRECNVYYDNLFLSAATDYNIDAIHSTPLGTSQNERWTWTPSGAVSSGTLTIGASDKRTGDRLVGKIISPRSAASSAGSGANKKLIVVGDSLVAANTITQTLLDVAGADVMGVTLYGTLGTGSNKHEGRSGWTVSQYVSSGSPFYIGGVVDFDAYLTANSFPDPDWVLIQLGINDIFAQATDVGARTVALSRMTMLGTLITSIKAAGASIKVGLVLPPPPSIDQDAFGASYGAAYSRWRHKRNILIWCREMIAAFSGQEGDRIYLVPAGLSLDTSHNMSRASSAAWNSRSTENVARQNNGVHPANSGYQQIGDAIWAFLKYYASA